MYYYDSDLILFRYVSGVCNLLRNLSSWIIHPQLLSWDVTVKHLLVIQTLPHISNFGRPRQLKMLETVSRGICAVTRDLFTTRFSCPMIS